MCGKIRKNLQYMLFILTLQKHNNFRGGLNNSKFNVFYHVCLDQGHHILDYPSTIPKVQAKQEYLSCICCFDIYSVSTCNIHLGATFDFFCIF